MYFAPFRAPSLGASRAPRVVGARRVVGPTASARRRRSSRRTARASNAREDDGDVETRAPVGIARAGARDEARATTSAARAPVRTHYLRIMRSVRAHARDAVRARRDVAAHVHIEVRDRRPREHRARAATRTNEDESTDARFSPLGTGCDGTRCRRALRARIRARARRGRRKRCRRDDDDGSRGVARARGGGEGWFGEYGETVDGERRRRGDEHHARGDRGERSRDVGAREVDA